jgi:DNA invertase Pin-like site-specific DNA recombinase
LFDFSLALVAKIVLIFPKAEPGGIMSEADRQHYAKIKADPVKYAAYLERKRRERKPRARSLYEAERKRKWRRENEARAKQIRQAGHRVETAIDEGLLIRAKFCSRCGSKEGVQAHHPSYSPEHLLIVEWLCRLCHPKADKERRQCTQVFKSGVENGSSRRGGGRNKTPDSVRQKVVELRRSGMTLKAIAAEVKLSSWTVGAICKECGEHSRSREVVNEELVGIMRQVFASGFTKAEIARVAGISRKVVDKIIRRIGAYGSLDDAQPLDSSKVDVFEQQLKAARVQLSRRTRMKTPEEVSLIRKMNDDGASYDDIQKATGACHMTIAKIVKCRSPYADPSRPLPESRGPHKRTSKQVDHVREMRAGGASYDDICGETRLSSSTIWRILKHPEQFGSEAQLSENMDAEVSH